MNRYRNSTGSRPQGGGRIASTTKYRKIVQPDHPLAQADGKVYVHRAVLYDKIGTGEHPCHWCKTLVAWLRDGALLIPDHVDGNTWNNDPDNLVPSCYSCNITRGKRADLTRCVNGHEMTPENTYTRPDTGTKLCRTCRSAAFKKWKAGRETM